MPEFTGIDYRCPTCGRDFETKRALICHSRRDRAYSLTNDPVLTGHSSRKTKIARTSRDSNSARDPKTESCFSVRSDSPLEIKNTNQASSPDDSVSAHDTADHSNNQDELSVHTAETSQSSDFDYANLGEDTQSDAESTSSVLDGLDSHFFLMAQIMTWMVDQMSTSTNQPLQPTRMLGTFQPTHAFK